MSIIDCINEGGNLSEVCRETNNNINQAPVPETDNTHQFVSLREAPVGTLVHSIRSTSPTAAMAIVEAGLEDLAEHLCTVKLSAQLLAAAISEIKLASFDERRGTNLYLVLADLPDGRDGLRFLYGTSRAAVSEIAKKEQSNIAGLLALRVSWPLVKAAISLVDSGEGGFVVIPSVISESI